jgi:hypothetical protein
VSSQNQVPSVSPYSSIIDGQVGGSLRVQNPKRSFCQFRMADARRQEPLRFLCRYCISVVEMISELLFPLNARGGPVKLYRPAISYISICKELFGHIRAERELKGTLFELNIRDPS